MFENIVDTHAHFAVLKNKAIELSFSRNDPKIDRFFEDLNKLRRAAGSNQGIIGSSSFLENYLSCMDANNISIAWLHQLSFEEILGYEVLSNNDISEAIQEHPDRFIGFASVDPRKGERAVQELAFAIQSMGLHGLKLNPNDYGGFLLNDRNLLYPLYEKACELKIPVSVHTGITPGTIFRMKHNYPILLDDVAVDFPELTIIVEHMGYPWSDLSYYMVERHPNMFITITAVANILIHSKSHIFKAELAKMISQIGSEKILWGSDWTATPNIEEVLDFFKNLSLPFETDTAVITEDDIDNILKKNALRILPQKELVGK